VSVQSKCWRFNAAHLFGFRDNEKCVFLFKNNILRYFYVCILYIPSHNEEDKIKNSDQSYISGRRIGLTRTPGYTRGGITCLGGVSIPYRLVHHPWTQFLDHVYGTIRSHIWCQERADDCVIILVLNEVCTIQEEETHQSSLALMILLS
jgi:hypothetical protein